MNAQSAIEFAKWLKVTHPKIYAQAVATADEATGGNGAPGLGQATEEKSGWLDTFMKTVGSAGSTYLQLKNQRDQLKINLQRAQAGMEPIDVAGAPVITTQVQLPPETVSQITRSAGMNVNKILMFAGVGLVAYMLLR